MHAIDGMACAKRGCDNRGKLSLNIVGHGSFPGASATKCWSPPGNPSVC